MTKEKAKIALSDFYISAFIALSHIDRLIKPTVKKDLNKVAKILELDSDTYAKFEALILINAYNAGQGTLRVCLRKFYEHLLELKMESSKTGDLNKKRKWNYVKDMSAMELFTFFAKYSKGNKSHRLYKKEASEYVFLVLASAQALFDLSIVKLPDKEIQAHKAEDITSLIGQIREMDPWWRVRYDPNLNQVLISKKVLKKN
jgi:hypothetical protein